MAALFGKKEDKDQKAEAKTETVGETKQVKSKEDTGDAFKVLVRPVVSEKAYKATGQGKYVFSVSRKANKIQVRNAIEKVYDVKVEQVNIINVRGKSRNFGRTSGRTSAWKKAVVTLKKGQTIGEASAS